MPSETLQAVTDAAVGVLLVAMAWSARTVRDRRAVLAVSVAWVLGWALPELVALHRGVLAAALLLLGYGASRRNMVVVAATTVGVLLSLPGLPPAAAAGGFLGIAVALQSTSGPQAAACSHAAWTLTASEALVVLGQFGSAPWTATADVTYMASVPAACALMLWWGPRARRALDDLPAASLAAGDPFSAIGAVLRDALHDRALLVVPADAVPHAAAGDRRDHLVVDVRGEPWAVVTTSPGVLADDETAAAVLASLQRVGEHAHLLALLEHRADELAASRSRLLDAADHQRDLLGPLVDRLVLGPLDDLTDLLEDWPDLADELRGATVDIDAIMRGYPPVPLGDGRLVLALRTLGSRLPVAVVREIDPDLLATSAVETVLYAAAAEAMTNAAKHAHASTVHLEAGYRGPEAMVRVSDDGIGGARADGFGLHALRLRVETRGGRLLVAPTTSGGTCVEAFVPVALTARAR